MSMTLRHLPLAALALGLALSAQAERAADLLAPVVQCVKSGKFKLKDSNRLPESVGSRTVLTEQGPQAVSLADGYMLVLTSSTGAPFLNFKIELSRPEAAQADRRHVASQMKTFSDRRAPGARELARSTEHGVETLALHQPDLNRSGPLSFISLFAPAQGLIGTLYVLNQEPGRRDFTSYAEYEVLRDEALHHVRSCMVAKGSH